jgi:uracil-DNA glycosylase
MSNKKPLGEEVVDHLKFYKSLGVKWTKAAPAAKPGKRTAAPAATAKAASKAVSKAAAHEAKPFATMKETLPASQETLESIRNDLGDCRRCKLAGSRTNIVFGFGNSRAELMFVGEAPGADEDEQGLPFVGRAGQLLTKIIEAIEMSRQDVYICNILKCRPPGNRNPETDEIATCEPFLFRQIAAVKPKVICTLGTFGSQTLLRTTEPISKLRGRLLDYRGIKLMATFHPAYLLRNPNEKRKVWEDVQTVRDYLRSLKG